MAFLGARMRLEIKTDFRAVQRKLDQLEQSVRDRVTARILNRTADIAKTAASKEIRSEYNLSAAKVRERLVVQRARPIAGKLVVALIARGSKPGKRAMNLIHFVERSTSLADARRRKKNETLRQLHVQIKRRGGKKPLGPYAFIGNRGRTVFTRRSPTGAISRRLPIYSLQTIDMPQMFNAKRINAALVRTIRERLPQVAEREIRFELSRLGLG